MNNILFLQGIYDMIWKRHSNNLIQDKEGNKENGYIISDSNKTKINDTEEASDAHKNILKEEILQIITENFMEMILDTVI
jgi:hypothetical protein